MTLTDLVTSKDLSENLRIVTYSKNNENSKRQRNNKTGYKGVHFSKVRKKYRSQIYINGKQRIIGFYTTPEEAARAYDKEAVRIRGKDAVINFPKEGKRDR